MSPPLCTEGRLNNGPKIDHRGLPGSKCNEAKGCPRNENTLLIVTQIKLSMTFLYTSYREDHNSSVLKLLNSVGLCQKPYLNQDI